MKKNHESKHLFEKGKRRETETYDFRNKKGKKQAIFPKNILPQSFQEGARAVKVTVESGKAVTDCRSGQSRPKLWEAGPGRTAG